MSGSGAVCYVQSSEDESRSEHGSQSRQRSPLKNRKQLKLTEHRFFLKQPLLDSERKSMKQVDQVRAFHTFVRERRGLDCGSDGQE